MGNNAYLSFYLQTSRIHIFQNSLKAIGNPNYICFFMNREKKKIIVSSYNKRDFRSHRVPKTDNVTGRMEVRSLPFSNYLISELGWNRDKSYRVSGTVHADMHLIEYDLLKAQEIDELEDNL